MRMKLCTCGLIISTFNLFVRADIISLIMVKRDTLSNFLTFIHHRRLEVSVPVAVRVTSVVGIAFAK